MIKSHFTTVPLYRQVEPAKPAKLIDRVTIGHNRTLLELRIVPPAQNENHFFQIIERFFNFKTPKTVSAKSLAVELAHRSQYLKDILNQELARENVAPGDQELEQFYKAFKNNLIESLTQNDFADLFAQTITYGLFAARIRAKKDFERKTAYLYIPPTLGLLHKLFYFIGQKGVEETEITPIIDEIADVLTASDIEKVVEEFHKQGKGKNPIAHFYETFLAEYDKTGGTREKRGVYYTPDPVVSYITHSVNRLLKEKFDSKDGFATPEVNVLDPAAGTLTFIIHAVQLAADEIKKKFGGGGIDDFIESEVLAKENDNGELKGGRFFALELLMAPYVVGHLNINIVLNELGYELKNNQRFNLYLANTLDIDNTDSPQQQFGILENELAKESAEAAKIKNQIPIMVVLGNPPYSGHSENVTAWTKEKIKDYQQVNGESLGERNPKWLQDDYVKFFRFAQWKVEQNGQGIVGFITNHAWLDNPTFRGMRASLMKTFDEIYILNLHGSALKKEKTPRGGKDDNVFDIQPGVAITLLVKLPHETN